MRVFLLGDVSVASPPSLHMTIVFIMTTETLDPRFAAYLTANRDFVDGASLPGIGGLA
jgi:hypothetical protein